MLILLFDIITKDTHRHIDKCSHRTVTMIHPSYIAVFLALTSPILAPTDHVGGHRGNHGGGHHTDHEVAAAPSTSYQKPIMGYELSGTEYDAGYSLATGYEEADGAYAPTSPGMRYESTE